MPLGYPFGHINTMQCHLEGMDWNSHLESRATPRLMSHDPCKPGKLGTAAHLHDSACYLISQFGYAGPSLCTSTHYTFSAHQCSTRAAAPAPIHGPRSTNPLLIQSRKLVLIRARFFSRKEKEKEKEKGFATRPTGARTSRRPQSWTLHDAVQVSNRSSICSYKMQRQSSNQSLSKFDTSSNPIQAAS